ncbi:MAG: RsmE family RNA methyltransferase [Patescibacteria group bacterium]
MKIHRFYLSAECVQELKDNGTVEIGEYDADFIHQLSHVLRFKSGDFLNVFNEEVGEVMVSIVSFNKRAMTLKLEKVIEHKEESSIKMTLAMSLIKKDKFELITEKATELGVSVIIPIMTERVVQKNVPNDRLLRIIKEATEQSGRLSVPELKDSEDLENIVGDLKKYDTCLFGNMEGELSFKDIVEKFEKDSVKNLILFIGPEGGWTEKEVEIFKDSGVQSISIHSNTLRAETAAIGVLGFLSGITK